VSLILVVDVVGFGVEGGEGTHGGLQHPHRVGVVAKPVHEVLDVLVHVGVMGYVVGPAVQLFLRGKMAVVQEVGHFQVVGVLAQLLNGDAPVLQDALLPIYVGYGAPATRRIGVAWVVGHQAEVFLVGLDLPEVHRPDGAVLDLDLVAGTRPVVGDR
jgi:hypothetical protein